MRRKSLAVASYTIAALAGAACVVIALVQLWSGTLTPPRTSVIAFAIHDPVDAATVRAQVVDVDPNDPSADLSVYLAFTMGAEEVHTEMRITQPSHDSGEGDQPIATALEPEAASIVLAGPLATSLRNCNDDKFHVTRGVEWAQLTNLEQKAIIEHLQRSESRAEIAEGANLPDAEQVVSADAIAIAAELEYTTIEPTVLYPNDDANLLRAESSEETFELAGWFNYVTCQFGADPFWSDLGTRKVFAFPAFVAASASIGDEASVLESYRRVQILPAPYMNLVSAEGIATDSRDGSSLFESWNENWKENRPIVTEDGFRLYFADIGGVRWREFTIFLAGIGVSLLATLAALLIMRISAGGATSPGDQGTSSEDRQGALS